MASPRLDSSLKLRRCLGLKVVVGLFALAALCFYSLNFSAEKHISQLGILGVTPTQWNSEKPQSGSPVVGGDLEHGQPRDETPGKQGREANFTQPRIRDLPPKPTDPPEEPGKVAFGTEGNLAEDGFDIKEGSAEDEEVAWVPKKVAPKVAVQDKHASDHPIELRAEVFECNYTDPRADFCVMKGDVQVNVHDKTFQLLARNSSTPRGQLSIKPFPRKQFPHSLDTVTKLTLESVDAPAEGAPVEAELECSEMHEVPGVVFSTAGHTGNYYHDMNDGWVPIYITTYPYEREVVFIVSDPVGWWFDKYAGLINALTKYPILKLGEDQPVHCFKEVHFGLISHGDMAVDETRPPHIRLEWLGQRWAKVAGFPVHPTRVSGPDSGPLRLGWVHRAEKERNVLNEAAVLDKAREMGFEVVVLNRFKNMEEMFQTIQRLDVLAGLHGSGLSNFIFMRGNCVLIQLVPFQLEWFSDNSFGIGAQISRVKYLSPLLTWNESSLSQQYAYDSDLRLHPEKVSENDGWQAWASYYLEANVTLRMETVETVLQEAKDHLLTEGAVAEHRPWLEVFNGFRRKR